MAKRSDFTQKLLDDLRLRKERMVASQTSNSSMHPTFADAYAYSKRGYTGSRVIKTLDTTSSRGGGTSNRSSAGIKLLTSGQTSKEIVPFGRSQKPEQIGDLSMVLSLTLENGGQIARVESSGNKSFFKFLQQIGKRRMGLGKTENRNAIVTMHQPSASQLPALSHLQVEKISKGVQKLNQILQVCSDRINFDMYSVEIGKELLKGAMDLEESLQMVVSLQEASEYMITPRRKSTVTLLEHDEDDDRNAKTMGQKQLNRPRFSFDKSHKTSRDYYNGEEVTRTDFKLRLAALAYPSEAGKFNQEKEVQVASKPRSHKRSASYGADMKSLASFSEQSRQNTSQSKQEKGKISNVIAKLMGLDDLPGNAKSKETKNPESISKPRAERMILKKAAKESNRMEERTKGNTDMVSSTMKQTEIKAKKTPETQTTIVTQVEKILATRNCSIQVTKQSLRDLEEIKPVTSSRMATIKVERQEKNVEQVNHYTGRRYESQQERKQDAKLKEGVGTEKGETSELVFKGQLQQTKPDLHKRSKSQGNLSQGNALRLNSLGLQMDQMQQKPDPQEKKRHTEEMDQRSPKPKLLGRKQKGNVPIPNNSLNPMHIAATLPKRQPQVNQASATRKHLTEHANAIRTNGLLDVTEQGDLSRDQSSANLNFKMKDSTNMNFNWRSTKEDQECESSKDCLKQPAENQSSAVQTTMKARSVRLLKLEMPPKINEEMTKKRGNLANLSGPLKHQSLIKEEKPRRQTKPVITREVDYAETTRSKEEVLILRSQKPTASAATSSVAEAPRNKALRDSNLCNPLDDECKSLDETQTISTRGNSGNKICLVMSDQPDGKQAFSRDEEFKIDKSVTNDPDGSHDKSTKYHHSQFKQCTISKTQTQDQLTESENQVKQILVKNQLFINTAEALFKLNIPLSVLQASEPGCQDEDSKLVLDCGYEVMKRKGRRKELSVHPFVKATTTNSKRVKNLNDLIIQLHKDLETLKFYGREGIFESLFDDLLPKMLERDVYYKDADLNCMWDFGWSETMFTFHEKDDVIRDVERQVLNGLIDEVTRDLCTSLSIAA